jgi:MinD superfamily P-loop ATPase
MVFARLNPGDENSGRLVSLVRQEVRSIGEAQGAEVVLIDGPPGIACPAIASLTGTSLVVFVAEPSKSGLHDLKRAIELAKSFNIPTGVCVNRWDINPEITVEIESFAEHAGAFLLGRVPYDEGIVHAQLNKLTAVEVDSSAAPAIREVWGNVCRKGGINEQGTI